MLFISSKKLFSFFDSKQIFFGILRSNYALILELGQVIECYIRIFLLKHYAEYVHQKLILEPNFIFINSPKQTTHVRSSFLNRCFVRGSSKILINIVSLFLLNPVLLHDIIKETKRDVGLVISRPLCFRQFSRIFFTEKSTTWLIQSSFNFIRKIVFTNLYKTYRDVIPLLFDGKKLEKNKNCKKLNNSRR